MPTSFSISYKRKLCLPLLVLFMLVGVTTAQAETTRADLLKMPGALPFTAARIKEWQPLVAKFGDKVFSDWERGLYEGAVGKPEQSRQWLLKAAAKGTAPDNQALCLAYKLARGSVKENPDDLFGEKKKADAAMAQVQTWYESAVAKQENKRGLTPEEKAAFTGVDSLPDGDEGEKLARRRIVICRNLTDAPSPNQLFRAALNAKQALPPYALNYLGAAAEEANRFDEAANWYAKASEAGFPIARSNQIRLRERMTSPAPGDRAWESLLVGYRQQAEAGDGSATILLADSMERGISGPTNQDVAILLYKAGLDAARPSSEANDFNDGMAYVFLALYAQERLTEHYQAGRFTLDSDDERKKYLSMQFLLKDAFGQGKLKDKP